MNNKKTKSTLLVALILLSFPLIGYYQSSLPGSDPSHSTDTYNELLRKAGTRAPTSQGTQTPATFQQGSYYQQGPYNQQGYNQQGYYYNPSTGTYQRQYTVPRGANNMNPRGYRNQYYQNNLNQNVNNQNPVQPQ